jgi:hypothetical protein
MNDEFIAVIAEHVIFAFVTLPHTLSFLETFAAVVAKEPVVAILLFLLFRN